MRRGYVLDFCGFGIHRWFRDDVQARKVAARWARRYAARFKASMRPGTVAHILVNESPVRVFRYPETKIRGVFPAGKLSKICEFVPEAASEWCRA